HRGGSPRAAPPPPGAQAGATAPPARARARLEQTPYRVPPREDLVLHVDARPVGHAREARVQRRHPALGAGAELALVDEILLGMATPREEHRGADGASLRGEGRALLQEAAEWGEARAGADHDDGRGGVVRETECRARVLDERLHHAALAVPRQVIGAHAFER